MNFMGWREKKSDFSNAMLFQSLCLLFFFITVQDVRVNISISMSLFKFAFIHIVQKF